MLAVSEELQEAFPDAEKQRGNLERQMARLRDLYVLGDYTLEEYQMRKKQMERKLETFESGTSNKEQLESLAVFLSDISIAWENADQEQRNKLARCLFDQVWLDDKSAIAVKPKNEFDQFFKWNYEEFVHQNVDDRTSTRVELHREHWQTVLLAA